MSDTEDIVVIENHPLPLPNMMEVPEYDGAHGGLHNPKTSLEQDYYMQLLLLEQQNKKRMQMARQEQDSQNRRLPVPMSPSREKDTARCVEEPSTVAFSPPPQAQKMSVRRVTPCPPGTVPPGVSTKNAAPATNPSLPRGPTPASGDSETKQGEENAVNGQEGDFKPTTLPADIGTFWSNGPPTQFPTCPPLPAKSYPGPVPPPPPQSGSHPRVPQGPPCYVPPPPMAFNPVPLDSWCLPPGVKKGKNKAPCLPVPPPPPPPVVEVFPPIPPAKPRKYTCRLHYTGGSKCRATFNTYSARRNHEAVHYDVRANRRGRARDRFDSDEDSVASWDDSDSEASDCEYDSSNRAVRFLSSRALLRCGENDREVAVTFEPFGRNVYVTAYPATVVDFKKFLPFLRHADLESWYVYPTARWLSKTRALEAAGCEISPMIPVERPAPAALYWPTIAVTAALTSSLEDEIGECDVDPDSNECDMRAHRTLPPHKSLKPAKNELAYYSVVSTVVSKMELDSPYVGPPTTGTLLPRDTPLFKVVRTGSREAAAAQAFLDAGAKGWSTVFTCVVKEGAELSKMRDEDFVRVEQCWEVVGKGEGKHSGNEKVFY